MLVFGMAPWLVSSSVHTVTAAEGLHFTNRQFNVYAIGRVESNASRVAVVLDKPFAPALVGLDRFSHVWVLWWLTATTRPGSGPSCRSIRAGTAPSH